MNIQRYQRDNRQHRISAVTATIIKSLNAGIVIDEEKLMAVFSLEMGCSRRTMLEYIKTICLANGFIRINKEILTQEMYDKSLAKEESK